jgi:type I restriction enzyme S subunit
MERNENKISTLAMKPSSQSRTLASLRDTLLPKLLSGEIRVKDANKFIGGLV